MPSYRHRDLAVKFASALLEADHPGHCDSTNLYRTRDGLSYKSGKCDCGLDQDQKDAKEYLDLFGREGRKREAAHRHPRARRGS